MHALKVRFSERRVALYILITLASLTAAFYRDFAHLAIPLPVGGLFVTELALLCITALFVIESLRRGRVVFQYGFGSIVVICFLLWGLVCLYRGKSDGLISLRDSATNYYAMFFLAIPVLARSDRDLVRLIKAVGVGTAIAAIVVLFRVVTGEGNSTSTGALRYHSFIGVGGSLTAFWLLASPARSNHARIVLAVLAGTLMGLIVVATQHRSAALGLLAALTIWILALHRGRGKGAIGAPLPLISLLCIAGLAVGLNSHVATNTLERLQTIDVKSLDFNVQWRLVVWGLLIKGFLASPIIGNGFGANFPVFHFHGQLFGIDPSISVGAHNSYLWVAYKEGLIGLLLLGLFIAYILTRGTWHVLTAADSAGRLCAAVGLAGFVYVLVYAAFNVVLEGPYMGMLFWLYAGIVEAAAVFSYTGSTSAQVAMRTLHGSQP